LLHDATERVPQKLVRLTALVPDPDEPFLGVVQVLDVVTVGLDAPRHLAQRCILEPGLGAVLVDMNDESIFGVVGATDGGARRAADLGLGARRVGPIAGPATTRIDLLDQVAERITSVLGSVPQRISQGGEIAERVALHLRPSPAWIDAGVRAAAFIVFVAAH